MKQLDDILQAVKSAKASTDTAIVLIGKSSGPDRALMEGHMGATAVRELRDAMKKLEKARSFLVELDTALGHEARKTEERRLARSVP
jgi:hypothetical protein